VSDKASRVVDIDALQSKLDRLKSGQFEHYDDDGPDVKFSETPKLIELLEVAIEEIRGRRMCGCRSKSRGADGER